VVDPYGRVLASLHLGMEGVLDAALPNAIAPPVFARYGKALVIGLILCCWFAAVMARSARQ
jgi:apolipoprotein N-acyltransferase